MSAAYRSAYEHIVGKRLAEVRHTRDALLPLQTKLGRSRWARLARIAGGMIGVAGAITMTLFAIDNQDREATTALVGSSILAIAVYVCVRVVGELRAHWPKALPPLPALTGRLDDDLARLDAALPAPSSASTSRLEAWSLALPLAATSLLAPLTLHWLFISVIEHESPRGYGEWIRISLMIVGHAHLALVGLSFAFAKKLGRSTAAEIGAINVHSEWFRALGITVGVSAVPGAIFYAIPPILSAITGLLFVPAMFVLAHRTVQSDRQLAESVATALEDAREAPPEAFA
jgi:hypothetical protein